MKAPLPLLLALALGATAAQAADPVTDAIQAAYAPYRAALFQTNQKSQPDTRQAMDQARRAWQALREQHAAAPGLPYARDPGFAATLAQVDQVYEQADAEVRAGRLAEAHEVLEKVRDLLADLRQRNGVVSFSDHMNAYHEAMEHLLDEGPKRLKEDSGLLPLMARVGVLEHLAGRLKTQAGPALAAHADFLAAQQAVQVSVDALKQAVLAGDRAAAAQALGKLKPPYSKMFLRFG